MAEEIKTTITILANLTKVQDQLNTLEGNFKSSFGRLQSIASSALGALGIGISAGSVIAYNRAVFDLADNLQNLHEQTGVSVQLLSAIKSPLEEAGSSTDAFAKGVFNLQKNLGNVDDDSDKVAQSIKRLGLNINELRNSSPDDFIKKVTDALAKIENPVERNTLLFNLLGKSARELGPAFQQLIGRFDELKRAGLTAQDVKAIDDVGDALTRLKNQALLLGTQGVANILRFYGVLRDTPKIGLQLDTATTAFARVTNLPKERVEGMTSKEIIAQAEQVPEPLRRSAALARDNLLDLREEFERINATAKQTPPAPFQGIIKNTKDAGAEIKRLRDEAMRDLVAGLDDAERESLAGGKVMIDLFAELKTLGLTPVESEVAAINKRFDEMKVKALEAAEATGQNLDALIERIEFFRRQQTLLVESKAAPAAADQIDVDEGRAREDAIKRTRDLGLALRELDERQRQAQQLSLALGNSFDLTSEKISIQRQRVEALTKEYGALSPQVAEAVAELRRLEQQQAGENFFKNLADSLDRGIADTLRGIREGNQTLGEGMKNLARNMLLSFEEEFTRLALLNPLKNLLMDLFNVQGQRAPTINLMNLLGLGGAPAAPPTATPALPTPSPASIALTTAGTGLQASAAALTAAAGSLTAAAKGLNLGGGGVPPGTTQDSGLGTQKASGEIEELDITLFDEIEAFWDQTIQGMEEGISKLGAAVESGIQGMEEGLGATIESGIQSLANIGETSFTRFFSDLGSSLMEGISGLTESLTGSGKGGGGLLDSFFSVFSSIISSLFSSFFHEGGPVPRLHEGSGRSRAPVQKLKPNEMLAVLEAGEFVFRKEAVRAIGKERLEKYNDDPSLMSPESRVLSPESQNSLLSTQHSGLSSTIPRFHDGGPAAGAVGGGAPLRGMDSASTRVDPSAALGAGAGKTPIFLRVTPIVQGHVIPKPGVDPSEVIQIVVQNIDDRAEIMQTIEQRTAIKGS